MYLLKHLEDQIYSKGTFSTKRKRKNERATMSNLFLQSHQKDWK